MNGRFHALLAAWLVALSAHGQGTFQNLDFESVNITPADQRGFFPVAQVFPGWIGYIGTNQVTEAYYNGISLGSALISVVGRQTMWSNFVVSGNYTAAISGGRDYLNPDNPVILTVAISQSSLVPILARSLRFSLGVGSIVADLLVSFNGQAIPFFPLISDTNFTVYGGDVSAFAGLAGELRFTQRPITWPASTVTLDSIAFSPEPIPEPGTLGLIGLGALCFIWRLINRVST